MRFRFSFVLPNPRKIMTVKKITSQKEKAFPKEWKENIEKSGKFFEQEIATLVCGSGFGYAVPNYAFVDAEQGISREMDVYAISAHKIGRKWNFIFPVLLISVSNTPIVCFTREDLGTPYTSAQIHYSGTPKKVYLKGEEEDLPDFLKVDKLHHHYKSKKISSQFWTPKAKNDSEGDYFYNELVLPLIKAVVAEKIDHEKGWWFDPEGEPINLQIYYPIIVVNQLWECKFMSGKPVYNQTDWVPFLFHTASKGYAGDYIIDICTKTGLEEKLVAISSEANKMVDVITKNRKLLEESAFKEAKLKKEKEKKLPF